MFNVIKMLYCLLYINTDTPEYSEILGIYENKKAAVKELLELANYRINSDGGLTQYLADTNEYASYDDLYNMVYEKMELTDVDIYRIYKLPVE
jgi:hypothetical protein